MRNIFYLLLGIIVLTSCTSEIKEVTEKYPDGSPKVITFFKKEKGIKKKIREIGYYQSQKESYKGDFMNDVRVGTWKYLYENGNTFAQTEFTSSIATQKWEISKEDKSPYMDKSYQLLVSEIFPNGSPYHTTYSKPNDSIVIELFFYPDYKIQMQGTIINNKREGKWNYWYNNGNPWSEGYFKNGISDSIRNVWYENGNKRYEGFYKNGKESGNWKFFDEKGNFVKEVNYDKIINQK